MRLHKAKDFSFVGSTHERETKIHRQQTGAPDHTVRRPWSSMCKMNPLQGDDGQFCMQQSIARADHALLCFDMYAHTSSRQRQPVDKV
jgi:hypothetical protein